MGAAFYSRPEISSAYLRHEKTASVYPLTIPGKIPYWVGNLETSDLFSKLTQQVSDWKKSITWWPAYQSYFVPTQILKQKKNAISLSHGKNIVDVKTEIINLLWPHNQFKKIALPKNLHQSLTFFGPMLDFNHAFSYPFLDNQKQLQRGLYPHHYLYIVRPVIIVETPQSKNKKTFFEGISPYFSSLNAFRQNVTAATNIIWNFPLNLKFPAQTDTGKIVFSPRRYTFAKPSTTAQLPLAVAPISVESAALMGDLGHTQLVLHLSQQPFYIIRSDTAHQTITLALDNINPDISSIPTLDTTGTALQKVAFDVSPENQLLVTMTLLPKIEIQGLRYQENNLILDLGIGKTIPYTSTIANPIVGSSPESAEVEAQPLVKKPVPLSGNELAAENYNEAVDLINQGNTSGAISMLQMLMTQHPDYLDGRLLLANLLLQQNQPNQALTVLQEVPSQASIDQNQTYFNILAEANRQSGNFKAAISVYQKLLMTNQSNGAWWVGLGMCFEGLKQSSAATEAYQKALATQNLSPVLQIFVTKKLGTKE